MKPKDVIGKKALRTRILRDVEMRALWAATVLASSTSEVDSEVWAGAGSPI
jgi:hypothetical protein